MNAVGVKELKNRLTHYLRRTKKGEEIVVTDRGTPIAMLHPIQDRTKAITLEARLAGLAATGAITLPAKRPLKKIRLVKASGKPISKIILDERR